MKLQNLVFPPRVINQEELPMYYRASDKFFYSDTEECYILSRKEDVWFDTYFNAFSLAKWKKYTHLNNLTLSLTLQGSFYIELRGFSLSREGIQHSLPFVKEQYSFPEPQSLTLEFPSIDFEIVFFHIRAITKVKIFSGAFHSDIPEEKLNDVNISLLTCTFRREEYLKRNLKLLDDEIFKGNDEAAGHLSIKVIDNGKTLDKQDVELNDKIRLYPNKNCGGAGGFTRGIIETLRDEEKFSHVLLMDDDVLINTESIIRTYNLLRIVKEEFKNAFIGGAMMRWDKRYLMHESLGVFSGAHSFQNELHPIFPLKYRLDVRDISSVLFHEKEENFPHCYQGWWYCCVPTASISLNDLPLPVFIRGDDIEYSLRKQPQIITLNAICVWHETFDSKPSNLVEHYFAARTMLLFKLLYLNQSRHVILHSLKKMFRVLIYGYNYSGAESLLDAFEDYMKGYRFYLESDPQEILEKQRVKNESLIELHHFQDIYPFFANPMVDYKHLLSEKPATFMERLMIRLTMGGLWLPDIFFKKSTGFLSSGLIYNPSQTFLRKRILLINPTTNQAVLRNFSRVKAIQLYWRCFVLSLQYRKRHDQLKREWQENISKVTHINSWSQILDLE